jgi:hypothetical protein
MKLNLIVATASNMGIGFQETIPWRLKYCFIGYLLINVSGKLSNYPHG